MGFFDSFCDKDANNSSDKNSEQLFTYHFGEPVCDVLNRWSKTLNSLISKDNNGNVVISDKFVEK